MNLEKSLFSGVKHANREIIKSNYKKNQDEVFKRLIERTNDPVIEIPEGLDTLEKFKAWLKIQ